MDSTQTPSTNQIHAPQPCSNDCSVDLASEPEVHVHVHGDSLSIPPALAVALYVGGGDSVDTEQNVDEVREALEGPCTLIEKSARSGAYYLTAADSVPDAIAYHDSQEYPEDWTIEGVYVAVEDKVVDHPMTLDGVLKEILTSPGTDAEVLAKVIETVNLWGYSIPQRAPEAAVPAAEAPGKVQASRIWLNRAEGPSALCGAVAFEAGVVPDIWAAAEATLSRWSHTAPRPGDGYDKVDVAVTYADGEVYKGRLDMTTAEHFLADHIRSTVQFYAGLGRLSAAEVRAQLREDPDEYVAWLNRYEIGGR